MTSEELAFIAALDAEPGDHTARLVYADWLDDRDDPRGPGYRAMGLLEKMAAVKNGGYTFYSLYPSWQLCHPDTPIECRIPDPWMDIDLFWDTWDSRCLAESALALKWAKLSPSQQARILADAGVMV